MLECDYEDRDEYMDECEADMDCMLAQQELEDFEQDEYFHDNYNDEYYNDEY